LVVIDEVQRKPELFELLRVLIDRPEATAKFLLLGSASPKLIRGVSESLAGRAGMIDLGGFDLGEVGPVQWKQLWMRGGFPRSYLAKSDAAAASWCEGFTRVLLERDLPQLGVTIPSETLRRFWTMLAHYHGQVWNGAEFARTLGSSEPTARRYLDILAGAFMVRILPPWHENLKKRQVKSPKVYVRDAGLLHALLGLETLSDVSGHPKLGASWEGFALEQVLSLAPTRTAHFWGTHGGAELDLMLTIKGKRYGFELKYGDAPSASRSMHIALADLHLEHLWIAYPGRDVYSLAERISVLPIGDMPDLVTGLGGAT